jgi:hypothetical protein
VAEHTTKRLRRSRTPEQQSLLSRVPGIEIKIEDLPDDPLTPAEERAAGPDRPVRPEPPDWFIDMLKRGASPSEILEKLRDRVLENEDLRQAQNIINDIGRLPGSGRLLRSFVTQDILNRLSRERHHE